MIADLVCLRSDALSNSQSAEDPKGYIRRRVRRYEESYEESEGHSSRLDNSPGSSALSVRQDDPRLHDPKASLPSWRRLEQSQVLFTFHRYRIRAKLASGEMAVRGDQWPLLMYAKREFNPEDLGMGF